MFDLQKDCNYKTAEGNGWLKCQLSVIFEGRENEELLSRVLFPFPFDCLILASSASTESVLAFNRMAASTRSALSRASSTFRVPDQFMVGYNIGGI